MQSNSSSDVIAFVLKLSSDISHVPIKMIHYSPAVQDDSLFCSLHSAAHELILAIDKDS